MKHTVSRGTNSSGCTCFPIAFEIKLRELGSENCKCVCMEEAEGRSPYEHPAATWQDSRSVPTNQAPLLTTAGVPGTPTTQGRTDLKKNSLQSAGASETEPFCRGGEGRQILTNQRFCRRSIITIACGARSISRMAPCRHCNPSFLRHSGTFAALAQIMPGP